jgi:hypothetical protein
MAVEAPLHVVELMGFARQLVAHIGMSDGNEGGDAFPHAPAEELRDSEFGHNRPDVGTAGDDPGAGRQDRYDPRDRATGCE